MRILWHSHAPWMPSSYGQQTALFVPRLRDAGYDVAISAYDGLHGGQIAWGDTLVYPGDKASMMGGDRLGEVPLRRNARLFQPDLVITLTDCVMSPATLSGLEAASFAPIEHDPLPEPIFRHFWSGAVPFAVTHDGERLLREYGYDSIYVPHAIDTNVFRPQDRTEARDKLGLPQDVFIAGMVAKNWIHGQKSIPEALEGFALFHRSHPDARLLVHTSMTGGTDIPKLARHLGISDALLTPEEDMFAAGLFDQEYMARLYSAMNVLLAPSRGEGFCLPLIEAQACGVPVIVTDFGAMAEIGTVGWKVSGTRVYEGLASSWWVIPNVEEIAATLEAAYEGADELREQAREHAVTYDADAVTETYLLPALMRLEERLKENGRVWRPLAAS